MKGLMVRGAVAASVCGVLACAAPAAPVKSATVTVSGYSGTTELTNFPVLVRISADRISGFSYSDCKGDGGSDLSFVDADGVALAHEIDTWNASGESAVWVKIPVLTNNVSFVMRWCDDDPASMTAYDTWNSDYVGVWHMGEANGTCANSTSHGSKYDATPMSNTVNSVLYSGSDAPVGGARTTATSTKDKGYLSVPSYDAENVGSNFTVSGWIRISDLSNKRPPIVARKNGVWGNGFYSYVIDVATSINVHGSDYYDFATVSSFPSSLEEWVHFAFAFNGRNISIFGNGAQVIRRSITVVKDNDLPLVFGCQPNGGGLHLVGAFDECRLKKGAASADWVKAEYDTVASDGFLSYGAASGNRGMMLIIR